MRRRWFSYLLYLQVCLCALAVSTLAQTFGTLRVNEAATRVALVKGQSSVALAVESHAARPFTAQIKLELLDPQDKVVTESRRRELIKPGASIVSVFLPITNAPRKDANPRQLLWYRVRYRLTPLADPPDPAAPAAVAAASVINDAPVATAAPATVEGIVSLSEITPDLFELRVAAAERASAGQLYPVRVRALHPLNSRPVREVAITAEISIDDGDGITLKRAATTDKDGYASFDFELPSRIEDDDADLSIKAQRGDVRKGEGNEATRSCSTT